MKRFQMLGSFVSAISALALVAAQGAPAAPVMAAPLLPTGIDLAIVRAAAAPVAPAPAPVAKVQESGGDVANVKCLVKFFEPAALVALEPVVSFQAKLICNDVIGTSEILIEQNDQMVVAGTIVNNQTEVTLHSLTVKLNEEQQDTFCLAIARQNGSSGAFAVVAQECFHNLGQTYTNNHVKAGSNGSKPVVPAVATKAGK